MRRRLCKLAYLVECHLLAFSPLNRANPPGGHRVARFGCVPADNEFHACMSVQMRAGCGKKADRVLRGAGDRTAEGARSFGVRMFFHGFATVLNMEFLAHLVTRPPFLRSDPSVIDFGLFTCFLTVVSNGVVYKWFINGLQTAI
jgi:hypothetical protein